MSYMFKYCSNLKTLDLSSFNTQNIKKNKNEDKYYEENRYMLDCSAKLERVIIILEAPIISYLISDKIFYA